MGNRISNDSMSIVASFFPREKIIPLAMMASRVSKSMQSRVSHFKLNDRDLLPFLDVFTNFMFCGKYNHKPHITWDVSITDLWAQEDRFRNKVMTLPFVRTHFQEHFRRVLTGLDLSAMTLSVFMQQSFLEYHAEDLHTNHFAFTDLPSNIQETLLSSEGKNVVRRFLLDRQIDNGRYVVTRSRQCVLKFLHCKTLQELKISANVNDMQNLYDSYSPSAHLVLVEHVFRARHCFRTAGYTTKRSIDSHNLASIEFWQRTADEYNEEVLNIMRRGQLYTIENENTNKSHFKTLKQCKDKAVEEWKRGVTDNGTGMRHLITNMIKYDFIVNRVIKKAKKQ